MNTTSKLKTTLKIKMTSTIKTTLNYKLKTSLKIKSTAKMKTTTKFEIEFRRHRFQAVTPWDLHIFKKLILELYGNEDLK